MTDTPTLRSPAHLSPQPSWRAQIGAGLLLASVVYLASLSGTWTRPMGHLATLWLANAVLLGLLIRFPSLAHPLGWAGALVGFLAAGLTAGDPWRENLLLTVGNLAGIVAGYVLYGRLHEADRRLESPASVLKMMVVIGVASATAALVGSVIDPLLFSGRPMGGGLQWFLGEAVNYVAILPALLTIPVWHREGVRRRWRDGPQGALLKLAPLLLLLLSFGLSLMVGGPGAVTYPLLPLMWCALSYGLFATALLTLLFSVWTLLAISNGWLPLAQASDPGQGLTSIRLGVTLIAVCPLVVASVTAAREAVLRQVRFLAEHDAMTGIKNRRVFHELSRAELAQAHAQAQPCGLLIFDIDHFKAVNDEFGHVVGDRVIVRLTQCAAQALADTGGAETVLGRLGGEEFGLFVRGLDRQGVQDLGERVRGLCEQAGVEIEHGRLVRATVSVGWTWDARGTSPLEALIQAADEALYRAKRSGRNRVAS